MEDEWLEYHAEEDEVHPGNRLPNCIRGLQKVVLGGRRRLFQGVVEGC